MLETGARDGDVAALLDITMALVPPLHSILPYWDHPASY
jgi:hypothetical protein